MKKGDKIVCIEQDARITVGKEYTVVDYHSTGWSSPVITVFDDDGDTGKYFTKSFKIVDEVPTLEDKIKLAKSYIGKKIISIANTKITPTYIMVVVDRSESSNLSTSVLTQFDKDGIVVVIGNEAFSFPVDNCSLVPEMALVNLNDNYTAEVYKDKIVVGCQTFPITILDELKKAHKSID